ncbi:uncharacterized protein LOC105700861 [Orussus abietinus]|uniref:uncharacterized protein LOC105700861 n=1 Tax=Orussus abietinus TaxID=222816 RepID=UPI000C715BAD|nr:uncharacterized protein LOC105700861 [Orussus abietinus]
MEDFEYVVKKQEQQRICFGCTLPRDTSTRKGMSPFMRQHVLEEYPDISPCKYEAAKSFKAVTSKPCHSSFSRNGYSGLARFASKVQNIEDSPGPANYTIDSFPAKCKELKYPFASTARRKPFLTDTNPGPGMYTNYGKRNIIFDNSFGGKRKLRLAVELKCCKRNTDVCSLCGEKPTGDYWHWNNTLFLCKICMMKERQQRTKYTKEELKFFHVRKKKLRLQKLRDCSDIHSHEGTDAKVWLMNPRAIKQWMYREAYLSTYVRD